MKKKRKTQRKRKIVFIVLIAVVAALAALYIGASVYFHRHFFPDTTVNGYDVSGMTAADADKVLVGHASSYLLTIYGRDGGKCQLKGTDFGYQCTLDHSSAELLAAQGAYAWPAQLSKEHDYTLEAQTSYDEEALHAQIAALEFFDADSWIAPADASLVYEDGSYTIQPEVMGNTPDVEHMTATIVAAVEADVTELTLTDEDYQNPSILSDDESLSSVSDAVKRYLNAAITYEMQGSDEVLDADTIQKWIVIDEDYQVSIDEEQVASYVQYLASKYNTYGDEREFATSSGDTVTIGGGDYGWIIDKEAEAEKILEDLENGKPVTREPCYTQRAYHEGKDDIGDTYVEIDYTKQHMWYYEKGELICESDIVSGNISRGNGSPDGIYKIVYKSSPATLVGEDYSSDVTYFMPFAYNVGIHDADWRSESEFGGTTYKTSGSHGCINVPYDFAEQLYGVIEVGTPVIAYYREEVTLTAENARISNAYSYVSSE